MNYLKKENKTIYLKGITKEIIGLFKEKYKDKFEYIGERDLFDYIYDAESLRSLAGRKNQKKRNHINAFLKEYEGRYEYKLLNEKNFDECLELVEVWTSNKENDFNSNDSIDEELIAIKKYLKIITP